MNGNFRKIRDLIVFLVTADRYTKEVSNFQI